MNKPVEVVVLVEGPTEKILVLELLRPYLAGKGVYITPIVLSKPGQKGGDVRFSRALNDIELHLKQRSDTWITLLVDYYGIRGDWPGYDESKAAVDHVRKAQIMNNATLRRVNELFCDKGSARRFIPYVSMFEIESLLFSDATILAEKLNVEGQVIEAIIAESGEPERINDGRETAPSKRLETLSSRYKKTTDGISIARAIGISRIRCACPLFNEWLVQLEHLRH